MAILGSALWDFAFKPLVLWLGEQLAFLTNLGSTALSDAMYREIAKGNYERVSLIVFQLLLGFFVGIILVAVTMRRRRDKKRANDLEVPHKPNMKKSLAIALLLVISGILFLQSVRTSYVVRAANHLEQLQAIIAPYITAEQRIEIKSRIAQIQSKSDYEAIVNEVASAIHNRHLVMPTFDPLR
ncbi:hypothetical protein [Bradyrhizobium shewense]|uniref:hypothetical protein n=1 Tax=Bradyrhizobium shewense TaxID=1761772 RepID=UPI000B8357BD|nr:hypothetical protein [Bradyrhizobium shewense]